MIEPSGRRTPAAKRSMAATTPARPAVGLATKDRPPVSAVDSAPPLRSEGAVVAPPATRVRPRSVAWPVLSSGPTGPIIWRRPSGRTVTGRDTLDFSSRNFADVVVAVPVGQIDHRNAQALQQALEPILNGPPGE